MKIVCKTTKTDLPLRFARVLNGMYGLTESELKLTAAISERYVEYKEQGLKEPFLSKFVFSTEERKRLCDTLDGLSNQNLGNKFKQLVDKKVLLPFEGSYKLSTALLPEAELTFKFEIVNDESREAIRQNSEEDGNNEVSS